MSRHAFSQLVATCASTPLERRAESLEARLHDFPRCGVTRYLLGCHEFDRARPAPAVRHMMIAHHAEPDLQSAALLVFAGLNWVRRRGAALLPVLLETWEEFRRPNFDSFWRERLLLDSFFEPPPAFREGAPLAERLWRLPIRSLRSQISAAMTARETGIYPALIAPT